MNTNEKHNFKPFDAVRYVPMHADNDPHHADCEDGIVSAILPGGVAVKFNRAIERLGWDDATAQTCDACDLLLLEGRNV